MLAVGAGPQEFDAERARRIWRVRRLDGAQQKRRASPSRLSDAWTDRDVEALVEGRPCSATTTTGIYKSKHEGRFFVSRRSKSPASGDARPAPSTRGQRVGEAVNAARVLDQRAWQSADAARVRRTRAGAALGCPDVTTEILDERRIGRARAWDCSSASREAAPSRRACWWRATSRRSAPATSVLGLVGKGITFDTGGISIKPADGMERMKDDMAGGATVIAALRAIALEQLPIRVIVVVPATENMPGGTATKPGDVHTSASGLDGRNQQHRRRRPPDSRRWPCGTRKATGRHAPRRRRHA